MSFLELARKRVSIRGYSPEPIDESALEKILEAGRLAPSAANKQPWHFIVLRDSGARDALNEVYPKDWFRQAPAVIIVCVEPDQAWTRKDGANYAYVDGAIAMDHMTLCAADLDLGTCWIGAFDPDALKATLDLPPGVEPVAMTPVGKPAAEGKPKDRKSLDDIIHTDRW